jgi:adenylate cyclase
VLRNFAGQPNLAIEHYNTSLRLSPRDRIGVGPGVALGAAYFFKRQFDDAAASLLASLEQAPSFAVTYRLLASCYAHMGRLDQAREIVARLRAITPTVMPHAMPWRNPEHRDLFLSGLRLAAGEAP